MLLDNSIFFKIINVGKILKYTILSFFKKKVGTSNNIRKQYFNLYDFFNNETQVEFIKFYSYFNTFKYA